MKALGILGTSSNAGKSWFATALCAWLRRQGVKVAPFKAQNMSNNACATLDGGEIGIAQAVQAAACGLSPKVEMNPILLKPVGDSTSQIIRLGKVVDQTEASDYYRTVETSWQIIQETLDWWRTQCDVLVMEGAGSPVELNLVDRDIANLRPIRYVNGRWILVADIERGGVFAQIAGTWALLTEEDQATALGYVINKFRGDVKLFPNPEPYLRGHCPLPHLGLLPHKSSLHIDEEDSLCSDSEKSTDRTNSIAWIRLPQISNSQDIQAWRNDQGLHVHWASTVEELEHVSAIVIPGTKNTIQDLQWLKSTGLAHAICRRAAAGIPIVGICGGFQILGKELFDETGVAGAPGYAEGLGLISMRTEFSPQKTVLAQETCHGEEKWDTYEIHSGQSTWDDTEKVTPLVQILSKNGGRRPEGVCQSNIWGSYQHGLFDGASMRQRLVEAADIKGAQISPISRQEQASNTFESMADLLEEHFDLDCVRRNLCL